LLNLSLYCIQTEQSRSKHYELKYSLEVNSPLIPKPLFVVHNTYLYTLRIEQQINQQNSEYIEKLMKFNKSTKTN